jgi:hypothetical protein
MASLTPAEIDAIAEAVVRKLTGQTHDLTKIAKLSLPEQKAYWKSVRQAEKGAR